MRPKLLKISGLNSFVEEQEIDFSTLIEGGLFGIFGPTGSGKSTILDAITIALYGYNAIARGTKEFINTDMEKVFLSYEFDCGNNLGRQAYRIERSIKKNKNGGIKTDFARLTLLDSEGNNIRIVDKISEIDEEVKNVIGLNHQDFTRSVVLPQGKFSEFLKLAGSERRNMLERILSLEKYGGNLVDKIRSYKRKREEELQVLSGELNRFDGVTEESIKAEREILSQIEKDESELRDEIKRIEKRYEELNKIWGLQTELENYLKMKEKLDYRSEEIEGLRDRLEKGRNAERVKPYLDRYNDTLHDIKKNKEILKDILTKLEDVSKKLEETKIKYEAAYLKKDQELPVLIEKEANVKNAIELKEAVDKLNRERAILAEKFKKCSEVIKKSEEKLEKLKLDRENNDKKIEELEERCKFLKVSPEYREKLNKAWKLKNSYDELNKAKEESLRNIEGLNKRIIEGNEKISEIGKALVEKESTYNGLKNELGSLEANPPKDNDYILEKEIKLHKLKSDLQETKDNLKKKVEIESELRIIQDKNKEAGLKLDYLKKRHKENGDKLEDVKLEIVKLENAQRAGILSLELKEDSPCPVCGSLDHPQTAKAMPRDTIEKIIKIKEGFEVNKREIEKGIYELETDIKNGSKEEEKVKKELDTCLGKLKDYEVTTLENDIKTMVEKIHNLKTLFKNWESKRKELIERVQAKEKEKITLEKQNIRYLEGTNRDKERLSEENKKRDELIKKLDEIHGSYEQAKKELNIEDVDKAIEEVRKKEHELSKHDEELKRLRNEVKKIDIERDKIGENLKNAMLERSRIEEAGKEKRIVIDEYAEKIKKTVGDREPSLYLKEIQEKKINIINEEDALRKLKEEEKTLLNKLQEKRVGLEDTNKALEASLINIKKDLEDALKENKFDNVNEVNASIAPKQELKSIEDEIKVFDDEVKKVSGNITRIRDELKGDTLDEADFIKFKEDMKYKKESHGLLLEEIGKKKERIREMEENYERVKEISEKIKKLEHITDMLNQMFKLVSGNKFVEYVATSHLRYIAKEASKRLMDITNKRYSLELDSKGNFIICDNYNGGVRRDCNTLSGGETFLTSLALALSLSSQIQLKGNASIEFFFLDEGFGTLDNHLLDTVMTSLEKLHQEKLAVGIISHVNELKNRVPIKLVVTPSESGLHGTKVAIEKN
ncbi:SbcC/MukB-like Walker B domain-containing protein [Wukongibacter baidiensis]|uniref:SbcC/MukB-like Walker B domain-containing protein n=1 Tax=Wukongibacter baidiensis TaxID=1723361 RepID=UPI003D7F4D39